MDAVKFEDMQGKTPNLDDVQKLAEELQAGIESAASPEDCIPLLQKWDEARRQASTWSSLVGLHFNQDTRNEEYKKARDERDKLAPSLTEINTQIKKALLASKHRPALEERFGKQAFALWEQDDRSFKPELKEDMIEESRLCAEYTELLASARFEFDGKTLTLQDFGPYLESGDRSVRESATRVRWKWFAENVEKLNEIFDKLTALRHGMAKKLGFENFIELGYLNMHRVDYDRNDVEVLRKEIQEKVVPFCQKLVELQKTEIGVEDFKIWDEGVYDAQGNPKPHGDHDWMLERATEMFDAMGEELSGFFRLMRDRNLLDLKSREGKSGGGFCTSFPEYKVPFVFANFNGGKHDAEVFTHEIGHAFQNWQSQSKPLLDYIWATHETAEIHSMSLEFLTWPWMEKFFEDDADRFRKVHLIGSIRFLPYGTAVDHFQHLIYERPNATPAERFEMWREMEKTYLPWRDCSDVDHIQDGGFWQTQRHIYFAPFYYIDYVLAQICALQFWKRADENREEAMRDYIALCKRGGEAAFQELATSAKLQSPFEPGCLDDALANAAKWLKIED